MPVHGDRQRMAMLKTVAVALSILISIAGLLVAVSYAGSEAPFPVTGATRGTIFLVMMICVGLMGILFRKTDADFRQVMVALTVLALGLAIWIWLRERERPIPAIQLTAALQRKR